MDLRLLQIFCVVFEDQSVSRAAQRLGLSQSTVSEHLKALEGQVGTSLFDRLSRQIHPTRAGEHLYRQARKVGDLERTIRESMARFLDRVEGRLLLGASTVPGEYLLPTIIGRYRERNPGVSVSLRIQDSQGVLDEVEAGRIDAGFVGALRVGSPLSQTIFAHDRLVVAVPVGGAWDQLERVSLEELASLSMLVRHRGSGTRTALKEALASRRLRLADCRVVAEFGSTTAIKEGIKAGVGCSVVSARTIGTELAAGVMRQVPWRDLQAPRREFSIATDSRRSLSPLVEEFLAEVVGTG